MAGVSLLQDSRGLGFNSIFDDDADATGTKNADNGPTTLESIFCSSAATAIVYVLLYDAIAPVFGTTAPDYQLHIQIGNSTTQEESWEFPGGLEFEHGLSWCAVTTGGTACSGDPSATTDLYFTTNGGN